MPCISEMSSHLTRHTPSRRIRRVIALASIATALPLASCDKSIVEPSAALPPIEVANVDAAAGTWRMIVLTGPDQVVVPEPAPVTGAAYLAEVQALKAAQANMTEDRKSTRLNSSHGYISYAV